MVRGAVKLIATYVRGGTSVRVAVLDPDPLSRRRIRGVLWNMGQQSVGYDRTQDLLDALRNEREFDLVVMAFEGGIYNVTKGVRELQQALGEDALLLVVAQPTQLQTLGGLHLGSTGDFILAPFSDDEMIARLKALQKR